MMLKIVPSNQFRRDLKLAKKRGLNINKLQEVVNKIATGQRLDDKNHDHNLGGEFQGFRECHIEPDWLLIYRVDKGDLVLFLLRTGTHADLF